MILVGVGLVGEPTPHDLHLGESGEVLVASLAAVHERDVVVCLERRDHALKPELVDRVDVGRDANEHIARRLGAPHVEGSAKAEVLRCDLDDVGAGGLTDRDRFVGRTRVDEHHLLRLAGLRSDALEESWQVCGFIQCPNDDRNRGHRRSLPSGRLPVAFSLCPP